MKRVIGRVLSCAKWSLFQPEHVSAVVLEMNSNFDNFIDDGFYRDFNEALDVLETDFDPTVPLVLTSWLETGIFSMGLDSSWLEQIPENGEEVNKKINNLFERLYLLERPTIAAVNGDAIGGGFILSLCCDFRFMEPAYTALTAAPKIGLPYPSSVYHIMRYEIPCKFLFDRIKVVLSFLKIVYKKFLLTGDKIDGNVAVRERISLKHRRGALDDALDYIANEIKSPEAFIQNKVSLKVSNYQHFKETEGEEIDRKYIESTKDEGLKERIENLLEKNKEL